MKVDVLSCRAVLPARSLGKELSHVKASASFSKKK